MKFVTINVEVTGTTPLLQHRFSENNEVDGENGKGTRKVAKDYGTPREQAEQAVYRDADGFIYVPSTYFLSLLCGAGANHKQKGSRRSLRFIVPAAVRIGQVEVPLVDPETGKRINKFEVDSRRVVIRSTGGSVMRCRPRFDKWRAVFTLVVNVDLMAIETASMLLQEGGESLGIGDFRPEKRGPFGCFQVTSWKKLGEPKTDAKALAAV